MEGLQILNVGGLDCYEKDGIAYLKLESVAKGLGFTTTQTVKGAEYTNIRWNRVDRYLEEFGFATSGKRPDFIPENIFYRLAMKAKNETAERFQAKVADDIIPSIRKHGAHMTENVLEKALASPDFLIEIATKLIEEQEYNKSLEAENQRMRPKEILYIIHI